MLEPAEREAALVAIGNGLGCDATYDEPADMAARAAALPAIMERAKANVRALSPAAAAVFRRWGGREP
jgi:hypothetical protein